MQNGVPWWYFHRHGGRARRHEHRQRSIPAGASGNGIGPERAIGSVVYPAAEVEAPGVDPPCRRNALLAGRAVGREDRAGDARLPPELVAAGLQAPVRADIRNEIWVKLWGNLSFNPISALTGYTLEQIAADPDSRAVARAMMVEATGDRREARRSLPDRRRRAGSKARAKSARTRPRCCRTSSGAGRWRSTRW